jgi:hypothetical protein
MTVRSLKQYFEKKYKIDVYLIAYNNIPIFASFTFINQRLNLLDLLIPEAIELKIKKELPTWKS